MADDQPCLLTRVEAYMERYNLAKTQFGIMALRAPGFVDELRKGRNIRERTRQRVEEFMRRPPPHWSTRASRQVRAYQRAIKDNAVAELAAKLHRQTDPFQRAVMYLQQQRYVVVSMRVLTGDEQATGWRIGQTDKIYTEAEVMDRAKRSGWRE